MKLTISKPESKPKSSFTFPIKYDLNDFGYSSTSATGKGVKVSFVGTGVPDHHDFSKIVGFDVMTEKTEEPGDVFGATVAITGMMCSTSSKNITGFVPEVELYSAKAFDNSGKGSNSSVIAAILWSIAKEVDLIVLPIVYETDNKMLKNAIQKAIDANIVILCSASENYPSKYKNVFSVCAQKAEKNSIIFFKNQLLTLGLANEIYTTTLGTRSFTSIDCSGASLAIGSAILVSLLETMPFNAKISRNEKIIQELSSKYS